MAGFGKPDSSNDTMKAIGWRLAHDEVIGAAIAEECQRRRVALTPTAVNALEKLLENPASRDHARAIAMCLDRTDPLQTQHIVKVEDNRPPSIEATKKVLDRIEELARRAGLVKLPAVIDADFQIVSDGATA